jgi:hypothetical protein
MRRLKERVSNSVGAIEIASDYLACISIQTELWWIRFAVISNAVRVSAVDVSTELFGYKKDAPGVDASIGLLSPLPSRS